MKCKFCNNQAIIKLKAYNLKLCEDHFVDFIEKRVEDLVKKIKILYNDRDLLLSMSHNIRKDFIEKLGRKKQTENWKKIFDFVLSDQK